MAKARTRNKATALTLVAFVAGMVGLSFASVPLYQLFCQVTGFAGTTGRAAEAPAVASERMITVRFDANVDPAVRWRFRPQQREVRVRLGEQALAFFSAVNQSGEAMTGTATFNVTPYKAAPYFAKIDCFCFTEQRLAAGEEATLPVQFFVDPEIYDNPNTRDVTTITLSYTFFRAEDGDGKTKPQAKAKPAPGKPITSDSKGSDRRDG